MQLNFLAISVYLPMLHDHVVCSMRGQVDAIVARKFTPCPKQYLVTTS